MHTRSRAVDFMYAILETTQSTFTPPPRHKKGNLLLKSMLCLLNITKQPKESVVLFRQLMTSGRGSHALPANYMSRMESNVPPVCIGFIRSVPPYQIAPLKSCPTLMRYGTATTATVRCQNSSLDILMVIRKFQIALTGLILKSFHGTKTCSCFLGEKLLEIFS